MVTMNPTMSITTLHGGQYTNKDRLLERIFKKDPTTGCLQETLFKPKDTSEK